MVRADFSRWQLLQQAKESSKKLNSALIYTGIMGHFQGKVAWAGAQWSPGSEQLHRWQKGLNCASGAALSQTPTLLQRLGDREPFLRD